jgi:ABC-2 type transport system ATP-binding protein
MIVVDRVSKYYGDNAAVRDLDFRIEEGECIGFLGLNGAGKSTTLRLLSCLLLPTSGRITVRGFDAEAQPHEIRKLIGYLPDDPPLYPEMRVESFLRFAGKLRRMAKPELERRLPQVLATTSLEDVADQRIGTLSHGYQQRVGIAQAIIHRPALLILDEPIQGLDPVQIVEMRELIRGLRGEHTILLSSHILSEIERTCDRLLMLHKGRIVAQGTEDQIGAELSHRSTGPRALAFAHAADLDVRGSEAAVRAALEGMDALEIVEIVPLGEGVVRVKVRSGADEREALAARVVGAGLGLLALKRGSTALEDIFVRLSREEEAQA